VGAASARTSPRIRLLSAPSPPSFGSLGISGSRQVFKQTVEV
jgi:hypothetical protein